MTHPLIEQLDSVYGYPTLSAQALDTWLAQNEHSVLFVPGEVSRYPEATDVAVVLPELMKKFSSTLSCGVAAEDDYREFARRFSIVRWPALVFFRGADYLGVITQIQDWTVYLQEIENILLAETRRPPGIGIPVITA